MCATPLHVPVLLQEVLENLPVPPSARILDLTLGLGGHAEALLARADADTRMLGVDRTRGLCGRPGAPGPGRAAVDPGGDLRRSLGRSRAFQA